MTSQARKIFLILVIIAYAISFAFTHTSFAFGTETHKAIGACQFFS